MAFEIENIRKTDESVKKIILSHINIREKSKVVQFFFINDKVIEEKVTSRLKDELARYLPEGYTAELDYEKRVCDAQILESAVKKYIEGSFPSVKPMLKNSDIVAKQTESGLEYYISAIERLHNYFSENRLTEKLESYLNNEFCEDIKGALIKSDASFDAKKILAQRDKKELLDLLPLAKIRTFQFEKQAPIEGEVSEVTATYMADLDYETDSAAVCGRIVRLEQKLTKKEKPYYIIDLSDGTYDDGIRTFKAKIFPYKRSLEKVAELKEGDVIAASGKVEAFNGFLSMMIDKICYAKMPENFVPEKLESRPAPSEYITISPKPYEELSQKTLFEKKKILPDDLVNNTFIVFDLETTGLNNNPSGLDKMDTIIEIGAVKIEGGIITEQFSTLIKPDRPISQEITKITGIDDEMVKDAPALNEVLPDFFKFTRGAYLVGHNVDFDYKFIRYYSKEMGFIYDNRAFDTLSLAQELLFLSNNKLNTVAAHFGFEFNHHRAADDAATTAKIFIELVAQRKCLPAAK